MITEELLFTNDDFCRRYIWSILQSKRFATPQTYNQYMEKQKSIGSMVLDRELPKYFESSFANQFEDLVSKVQDPFLTGSLPYLAAFGYSQGRIFYELRRGPLHIKKLVALASAIFNMGINIFDYLVDEFSKGKEIFRILDQSFLHRLMDLCTPLPSLDLIIQRYNIYKNKREQLLLWLVIAFSRCCRLIYQYNKNYESWTELSNTLFQLYDSEKRLIGQHTKNAITFSQSLLDTIRIKSVMPFLCTYFISKVAWPSILEEENVKDICNTVGNIFWISDDLADFVKDLKSGTPNCVLIYAEHNNIQIGQNHSFGKSIFHVALLHVIEHLLSLLQQLDGTLISTTELREFVRMYITAWLKC